MDIHSTRRSLNKYKLLSSQIDLLAWAFHLEKTQTQLFPIDTLTSANGGDNLGFTFFFNRSLLCAVSYQAAVIYKEKNCRPESEIKGRSTNQSRSQGNIQNKVQRTEGRFSLNACSSTCWISLSFCKFIFVFPMKQWLLQALLYAALSAVSLRLVLSVEVFCVF